MEKIISKSNAKIKTLRKLNDKRNRQTLGLFKVENLKIIIDALKVGIEPREVYLTAKNKNLALNLSQSTIYEITDELCQAISELDNTSGIIAVYDVPKEKNNLTKNLVYLNNINDPGNLGTILRTGVAFGFNNFILDETCADVFNQKTIQASKDAIFKINFTFDSKLNLLRQIKKTHILIATTMNGERITKIKSPFCLILGNESHGVDNKILKLASKKFNIRIQSQMESLNVGVAAGILFYELSK